MRLLGIRSALPVFRWDLIYLYSNLVADERPEIQALAPPVESLISELRAERDAHEATEDSMVVMTARKARRDEGLDSTLKRYGGVARATDKDLYKASFPRHNPTETARMALDEEVLEVARILGELESQPVDHPVRVEYEGALRADHEAVKAAINDANKAGTALALSRSRVERFKLRMDKARVEVHGRLLSILKDKAQASAFFRSTVKAPGSEEAPEEPAPEAAPPQA